MLAHRTFFKRGLPIHRLQSSQILVKQPPCPRLFTQNSQLRTISPFLPRTQLPYLYPATGGLLSAHRGRFQNQLVRFISSENKRYVKDLVWRSLRLTAVFMAFLLLLAIGQNGLAKEVIDRKFPAPSEWNWKWRYQLSKAGADQIPQVGKIVNWPHIASSYIGLLEILEDPENGGKGLQSILHEEGDIFVEGVGKSGFDLTAMSEPWRRGYYACLMGLAKAAEHCDGMVGDRTRGIAFPRESMLGPSNPNPKAVPPGSPPAPLEENCTPAFPPPETYYMKILTSHGFTSGQRLEAAQACADWLDFKGLSSTAEEMYDWGLDIATGSLPVGVNNIVDAKTGIINSKATYVSSNILKATTALAHHHARNDNLAAALPIFLSILRARRQLLRPDPPKPEPEEDTIRGVIVSMARSWLVVPPYPPPPATGDEVPWRTPEAICEEAAVMSHVGEILFASSDFKPSSKIASDPIVGAQIPTALTTHQLQNFQSGLSWTRDAVDLAEETLMSVGVSEAEEEVRKKCAQCLSAGMENWSTMVERMLLDERAAKTSPKKKKTSNLFWGGNDNGLENQGRWESEARLVDTRSRRVSRLLIQEQERDRPLWMRILGKEKPV